MATLSNFLGTSLRGESGYSGYSGFGTTFPISTTSNTTNVLESNTHQEIDLVGGQSYILHKIETSDAAWVRIYTNSSSRTADINREQDQDPNLTSGVIAEAITTENQTVVFSPAQIGFNTDDPVSNIMPITVTNLSNTNTAITVTATKITIID